jgi:hypothetical protein
MGLYIFANRKGAAFLQMSRLYIHIPSGNWKPVCAPIIDELRVQWPCKLNMGCIC